MLSGPRRAQAGSHLPTASARDQRSGSARPAKFGEPFGVMSTGADHSPLTGPRGDVASHFVGLLVLTGM